MNSPPPDVTWAASSESVTLSDLSEVCGLSRAELDELIDYGALAPLQMDQSIHRFSAHWVSPLRTAGKLRRDYDLELFSVAVLVGYLNQIDVLQNELRSLRAQLPNFSPAGSQPHPNLDSSVNTDPNPQVSPSDRL